MKKTGLHAKVDKALIGILLMSLLLRLFYITEPFSGHHSEKEVITASAARLLMGEQLPIAVSSFYDMSIKHYGEFILYLTKSMFSIFGIHEWAARLPMVLFAVFSVYLTYLIGLELFDRRTALFAGFLLSISPLHAYFGRVLIPEGPIVFFMLFSILYFHRWIKSGKTGELTISSLMMALAIHQKFTSLYLVGVYAVFLILMRPPKIRWAPAAVLSAAAITAPFLLKYLLYGYSAPLYTFGAADYPILLTLAYYRNLAVFFAFGLSPITAIAALAGFSAACTLILKKTAKKRLARYQSSPKVESTLFVVAWFAVTLLSIMGTGQWGFMHDYYLLVLVPPAAILAATALATIPKKYDKAIILALLLTALPLVYYLNYIEYPDAKAGMYLKGKLLKNESIIGSGTVLYYAEANPAPFWSTVYDLKDAEQKYNVRYIAYPAYLDRQYPKDMEEYLKLHYSLAGTICSDRVSFSYNYRPNNAYSLDLRLKPKCIRLLERK